MKNANETLKGELAALATMSPAQLKQCWVEVEASASPSLPPSLLRRLLAYRLQEPKLGGLPVAVVRELERTGRGEEGASPRQAHSDYSRRPAGPRVKRPDHQCRGARDGFWWKDQSWRSLSEIARTVTGAHWSGPRFFGLTQRG